MNSRDVCWLCGGHLIWGSDHDAEALGYEKSGIAVDLHCKDCSASVRYVRLGGEDD